MKNLEKALRVGEKLLNESSCSQGSRLWNIPYLDQQKNVIRLHDYSLLHGSTGIVLFLAELFKVSKQPQYLKAMREGINGILLTLKNQPSQNLSFATGKMGVVYVCLRGYTITNDTYFLNNAVELTDGCMHFITSSETNNSFFQGRAGVLSVLLDLSAVTQGESNLKPLIEKCIEYLVKQATYYKGSVSWYLNRTQINDVAGYAFGSAGIGTVLAKAAKVLGNNPTLQDFARQALHYSLHPDNMIGWKLKNNQRIIETPKADRDLVEEIRNNNYKKLESHRSQSFAQGSLGVFAAQVFSREITESKLVDQNLKKFLRNIESQSTFKELIDFLVLADIAPENTAVKYGSSLKNVNNVIKKKSLALSDGQAGLGYFLLQIDGYISNSFLNPINAARPFYEEASVNVTEPSLQSVTTLTPQAFKVVQLTKYFPRTEQLLPEKTRLAFAKELAKIPSAIAIERFCKDFKKYFRQRTSDKKTKQIFELELLKYQLTVRNRNTALAFGMQYIYFQKNRQLQLRTNTEILSFKYFINKKLTIFKSNLINPQNLALGLSRDAQYTLLIPTDGPEYVAEKHLLDEEKLILHFGNPKTGKSLVDFILNQQGLTATSETIENKIVEFLLSNVQEGVLLFQETKK